MRKIVVVLVATALSLSASAQYSFSVAVGGVGYEEAVSVVCTPDSGFAVAGVTSSYGNELQMYLVRLSASGDTVWTRDYGGPGIDAAHRVIVTSDGGFALAGRFGSDFAIVKTDALGDTQWTRTYARQFTEDALGLLQTSDGGFVVCGHSGWDLPDYDDSMFVVRTNAAGDSIWGRCYPFFDARDALATQDGNWLFAGGSNVVKTDTSGDVIWSRVLFSRDVRELSDGGFIFVGYGGNAYVTLQRTNADCDTLWTRQIQTLGYEVGNGVDVRDGGFIIGGHTGFGSGGDDFLLIRTDSNGDTLWTRTFGGDDWDRCFDVAACPDGGHIMCGYTRSFGDGFQMYVVKTDSSGFVGVRDDPTLLPEVLSLHAAPNPFNPATTIAFDLPSASHVRLDVYNILGQRAATLVDERMGAGRHEVRWDASAMASGVYFARIVADQDSATRKVVLLK